MKKRNTKFDYFSCFFHASSIVLSCKYIRFYSKISINFNIFADILSMLAYHQVFQLNHIMGS